MIGHWVKIDVADTWCSRENYQSLHAVCLPVFQALVSGVLDWVMIALPLFMIYRSVQNGFRFAYATVVQPGNCPSPKFSKTCLVVTYNNKLQSLCPPENISWLRPCYETTLFLSESEIVRHKKHWRHCTARRSEKCNSFILLPWQPRKLHKFDESSIGNDLANYDNSYRPLQRETHNDLPHRAPPPVPSVIPGGHNPPPDMNTTWSYPTPGSFGAVGSNPCCVYESDISHYHQYQSSLSESRGNDVIDYVTSYGDQYQHFKKSPYQSFSNFTPFNNAGICDARSESGLRMTGDALRELYEQSSDSQSGRRRFNLSVITLPTGTTSISSTPSPESTLSVDEGNSCFWQLQECAPHAQRHILSLARTIALLHSQWRCTLLR